MTDKATVVIPSPKKGKVTATHGQEGGIARVHHPLVDLEIEGGAAPVAAMAHAPAPSAPVAAKAAPVATATAAATVSADKVLATPVTRRMARELGIDLGRVAGTGPQGRVLKTDVETFVSQDNARGTAAAASGKATPSFAPVASGAKDQRIPLRGMRKKIAEKMVRSKFTAPHYAFVEEADMTQLVALRSRLNASLEEAGDPAKLSFLPFFCKALVAAFRKYPGVNANMDETQQELIIRGDFNFGIAAMTEQGLTVPVVKNVDRLSLRGLGTEIGRLATAAREQKLKLDELTGGTFTITSLGQQGGLFATPIINHPEVAIMGVHRMRKRPVVVEGDKIEVRQLANFSFCFDHRVVDGALGAQFAYEFLRYIEQPELLFLEMQ